MTDTETTWFVEPYDAFCNKVIIDLPQMNADSDFCPNQQVHDYSGNLKTVNLYRCAYGLVTTLQRNQKNFPSLRFNLFVQRGRTGKITQTRPLSEIFQKAKKKKRAQLAQGV